MALKLPDSAVPMGDFPVAKAVDIDFDDGENLQEKLDNGKLGGAGGGASSEKQIKDWVSGDSYLIGDYIYLDGKLYRCLVTNSDIDFDEANWEQLTYGIDDTEVRLDKTYSSSKIYQDIQQCLNDSKAYTLEELEKVKIYDALTTTDKTITGAINEVNGNLLDTIEFSADYKNIILNRKNGLNPYTIPISAIINNASLAELKDIDSTDIGNGKILVYDGATNKHKYVDSSITDELVKMDSATDAHYLADFIDKSTIVNENGILKVKMLDGQDVTIAEINHLKGLTMNVMDLVNSFANGGVKVLNAPVATYADLITLDRSAFIEGISYIVYVLADETHTGAKTTYLCDKTSSTYFGNADSQRNFTTNPIDLANEVTGKLDNNHIDIDSLWNLLTINDTYKTLTTKNEVFGTHGAKALYDELVTSIGKKANATDLTTHTEDTDIHITSDERTKWNKVDEKVDRTSITTTINSTSTDTQVPSAKTINDKFEEANVYKGKYVGDLNDIPFIKSGVVYKYDIRSGNCTNTPVDTNGILYSTYFDSKNYCLQEFHSIMTNRASIYRRDKASGAWGRWQKVCATSVEDIPVTNIAPADTTTFINFAGNSSCCYFVRNGICHVNIEGGKIASSGAKIRTGVYLPKSANCQGGTFLTGGGDPTPHAYVFVLRNSCELCFDVKDANVDLYGSFSYPVAE